MYVCTIHISRTPTYVSRTPTYVRRTHTIYFVMYLLPFQLNSAHRQWSLKIGTTMMIKRALQHVAVSSITHPPPPPARYFRNGPGLAPASKACRWPRETFRQRNGWAESIYEHEKITHPSVCSSPCTSVSMHINRCRGRGGAERQAGCAIPWREWRYGYLWLLSLLESPFACVLLMFRHVYDYFSKQKLALGRVAARLRHFCYFSSAHVGSYIHTTPLPHTSPSSRFAVVPLSKYLRSRCHTRSNFEAPMYT